MIEIGNRDVGDHLHLNRFRMWVHASPDEPEFLAGTVATSDVAADGMAKVLVESGGGLPQKRAAVPPAVGHVNQGTRMWKGL